MNKINPSYKKLCTPLVIFVVLFSFAAIIPSDPESGIQINKLCLEHEGGSRFDSQPQEENDPDQLDCMPYSKKINLYVLGIISFNELTMWVLGVDRRFIVLKMMIEKKMIQASDIADQTDRSLQNISYAMRELEDHGLIKCITPEKHTWKKFIPTEKGSSVYEELKNNNFID